MHNIRVVEIVVSNIGKPDTEKELGYFEFFAEPMTGDILDLNGDSSGFKGNSYIVRHRVHQFTEGKNVVRENNYYIKVERYEK